MLRLFTIVQILLFSIGIVRSQSENCYCLNIEASQSAMINECIKFNSDGEFVYKWQSDLAFVEEKGRWIKNGNSVIISTYDQPSDFIQLVKEFSETNVDSIEVQLRIEDIDTLYSCNLTQLYQQEYVNFKFDEYGFLKIKSDTCSMYFISAFLIPHQFRFKIEPNVKSIQINAKMMNKIHRTFFNRSKLLLSEDKLFWNQTDLDNKVNYWIKVGENLFDKKFK